MDTARKIKYLHEMGIQVWMPRAKAIATFVSKEENTKPGDNISSRELFSMVSDNISAFDLQQLKQHVSHCTQCDLHRTRAQTVFGVGHPAANWLIVGEAPGADEDRQGEPFVGRAGQLLNSMLRAIGLAREEVYIANILKCRPPNNRDPQPSEIIQCKPYLKRQIELIQPKIMLAVGRIAAQALLQTTDPIGRLRGRKYYYEDTNIPLVVTYHPAYLLRSPLQKMAAWEDLKYAVRVASGT